MSKKDNGKKLSPFRFKIHEIIYEAETFAGKTFDIILLICIIASIVVVMLESVDSFNDQHHGALLAFEWGFTIIFTIEYILRLYSVQRPIKYATSFYGVIDLLAILPAYLGLILPEGQTQYLMVIRALRLLRVFRIFKLVKFLRQSTLIMRALKASKEKIFVFLVFVLLVVVIIGSVMYLVEGDKNGQFANIPISIYWAIVTLTTVGYGDISPATPLGQFLAAVVMIMGYAVIAVPTGIVSAEIINESNIPTNTTSCPACSQEGHDDDAEYCKYCGEDLYPDMEEQ